MSYLHQADAKAANRTRADQDSVSKDAQACSANLAGQNKHGESQTGCLSVGKATKHACKRKSGASGRPEN